MKNILPGCLLRRRRKNHKFIQEIKKAQNLKAQIDATHKAIDVMVYELYELSEEEIKIIEQS